MNVQPTHATGDRVLPFSAKLKSSITGEIVPDGVYEITFNLYNIDTGGTPLWSEVDNANVSQGILSINLGTVTAFPSSITFDGGPFYIGVKVDGDPEMTPRKRIGSVPSAFNSSTLNGYSTTLVGAANAIPVLDSNGGLTLQGGISVGSSIVPTNNTVNLGSSTNHFGTLYADTISANSTAISGTNSQAFTIDTDQATNNTDISSLRFYLGPTLNTSAALQWNGPANRFDLLSRANTSTLADLNMAALTATNATLSGTLVVTGNTSLSTVSTSGLATLNSLSVTNNATISGTLVVTGNTSLSTVSTSGLATLNSLSVTNNATVAGTLGVTGNTSLSTVSTSGLATLNSLSVTNNASFSTLSSTGLASLNSLTTTGAVTVGSTLQATSGATTLAGLTVNGTATVGDNDIVIGASSANQLLVNASLNSDLVPTTDNTVSLGSASKRFANFYAANAVFDQTSTPNTSSTDFVIGNTSTTPGDTRDETLKFDLGTGTSPRYAILGWNSTAKYLYVNKDLLTQGNTTFGSASGNTVTSTAATWTFANATTVALTNSTAALNFDSNTLNIDATNHRVGVGTNIPQNKLQVNAYLNQSLGAGAYSAFSGAMASINQGTLYIGTAAETGANQNKDALDIALIKNGAFNGGTANINFRGWDGGNGVDKGILAQITGGQTDGVNTVGDGKLLFSTAASGSATATERLRIDSSGNVGINTSTPRRKLDVLDASNPQLRLTYTNNSVYNDLQTDSSGTLNLTSSGTGTILKLTGGASQATQGAITYTDANGVNLFRVADWNGNYSGNIYLTAPAAQAAGSGVNLASGSGKSASIQLDSSGNLVVRNSNGGASGSTFIDYGASLYLRSLAGSHVTLQSDGTNTGIGRDGGAGSSTLTVYDATASTGATQLLIQGGAAAADATTNNLFRINQGGGTTGLFVVRGNGNVGIGTTSPAGTAANGFTLNANSRTLELDSADSVNGYSSLYLRRADAGVGLDITSDNSTTGAVYLDSRDDVSTTGGFLFRTRTAGTPVTAMRILGNGNTTISTGSLTVQAGLTVNTGGITVSAGNSSFQGSIGIGTSTFGTNNALVVNAYTTADNAASAIISSTATTNKGLVVQNKAAQTVNALEVQSSGGTAYFSVGPDVLNTDASQSYLSIVKTFPTANTAQLAGVKINISGAGSASTGQVALNSNLGFGYTGSGLTAAGYFSNNNLGTGTQATAGGNANYAIYASDIANGTAGHSVGVLGSAGDSTSLNIGVYGQAILSQTNTKNIGVEGYASNPNAFSGMTLVGGYFGFTAGQPSTSAALIANNQGSTSNAVFLGQVNGTTKDIFDQNGWLGVGQASPASVLDVAGAVSAASWTTAGIQSQFEAATFTDTSTASGTIATRVAHSFAQPTFASSNALTVTDAATLYVANAPAAGTNTTITRAHALEVAAGDAVFAGNVAVGTTTPVSGYLLSLSAADPSSVLNRSSGTASYDLAFADAGTTKGLIGLAGATNGIVNGTGANDLVIRAQSQNILFSTDSGGSSALTISKAGGGLAANQLLVQSGTAANPSYSFQGNFNMGLFSTATNILNFSTNSAERLRIDSSGNVGIATTNTLQRVTLGSGNALGVEMTAPSGGSATPASGGSLTDATTYFYKVSGVDAGGNISAASTEFSGTTANPNLTLSLTWTAVPGAVSYNIYRTTTSGTYGATTKIGTATTNSFTDDGTGSLVAGTPSATNAAYANLFSSTGQSWFGANALQVVNAASNDAKLTLNAANTTRGAWTIGTGSDVGAGVLSFVNGTNSINGPASVVELSANGASANLILGNSGVTTTLESGSGTLNIIGNTKTAGNTVWSFSGNNQGTLNATSSTNIGMNIVQTFNPTSGTAVYNHVQLTPTINQTGGANGITRGLYLNPTLTAQADYRSIDSANGRILFTNTQTQGANYGNVSIGDATTLFDGSTSGKFAGSSSGTELAINAASGYAGNLIDAQTAGSSKFTVAGGGNVGISQQSPTAKLDIAGNVSAASWTTSGIQLQGEAATFTDTSGSGTIATRAASSLGAPTFASSNAVTITSAVTLYLAAPAAGSNTTITKGYALYANGNIRMGGTSFVNDNSSLGFALSGNASNSLALSTQNIFGTGDSYLQAISVPGTGYGVFEGVGAGAVLASSGGNPVILAPNRVAKFTVAPNGAYYGTVDAIGTVGSSTTLDVTKGNTHTITSTASTNMTITPSGAGNAGEHIFIIITSDATGGDVITFASTFKSSGTMTLTASKVSTIEFVSDGSNWYEIARTNAL